MNRDAILKEIGSVLRHGPGSVDFHKSHLALAIEVIAPEIIRREPGIWYDGIVDAEIAPVKPNVFTISGEMWVASGSQTQWKEPIFVRISDKRSTNQGVVMRLEIGDHRGETNLLTLLS